MTGKQARLRRCQKIVKAKQERRNKRATIRKRKKLLRKRWLLEHHEFLQDCETGLLPEHIVAPEVFSISRTSPRATFLRFLNEIQEAVQVRNRIVYIDFSQTEAMASDATLLLYAKLSLLNGTAKKKRVRCASPKNISTKPAWNRSCSVIEQVLRHVGIFDVLGKHGKTRVSHYSVRHWHSATGIDVDGSQLDPTVQFYTGTIAPGLEKPKLYRGLIEAMTNSVEHAYTEEEHEKRWWIFSEERDNQLTVVMCDQGIGIPSSLTGGKWDFSLIRTALTKFRLAQTDGSLIKTACELGRSITKEENRGKGLQEVKGVLDKAGAGSLGIFSGRGSYHYEPHNDNLPVVDFADTVKGTIITWKLPIPKESQPGPDDQE